VHLTLGILRTSQAFFTPEPFSGWTASPSPPTLEWQDIEALLSALGARTVEGRGSRVRFELNGVVAAFHRPHPEKEAKPYQVRDARRFLEQAGIKP
jgi:hypothetical protein